MREILKIEHIDNGWMLVTMEVGEDFYYLREIRIAFTHETDKEKYEAVENLLWSVLEEICPNSDHNPYTIQIKRKKNVTHEI